LIGVELAIWVKLGCLSRDRLVDLDQMSASSGRDLSCVQWWPSGRITEQ